MCPYPHKHFGYVNTIIKQKIDNIGIRLEQSRNSPEAGTYTTFNYYLLFAQLFYPAIKKTNFKIENQLTAINV